MLPPSGEEGCLPNENAGFPDTTNTTYNRINDNAEFPDTTKLCAEESAANFWRGMLLSKWECWISRHNKNYVLHNADKHYLLCDSTCYGCWSLFSLVDWSLKQTILSVSFHMTRWASCLVTDGGFCGSLMVDDAVWVTFWRSGPPLKTIFHVSTLVLGFSNPRYGVSALAW